MKLMRHGNGRCGRRQRGDVLLEYVLLMLLVIVPLVSGERLLFNPAGAHKGDLGAVGNAFRDLYTHLVMGISQPTP